MRGRWVLVVGTMVGSLGLGAIAMAAEEPPTQDCDRLTAAPADGFGRGVPFDELDVEKAIVSCKAAADEFPDSLRIKAHYGRALIKAGEFRQARELLETAAEAGHPAAQSTLGAVYYFAIGVKRNYRIARQWFEAAAEQENAVGLTNLGVMYTFGHGVRRDLDKAAAYFERGAKLGHPDAQTNLGNIYERGETIDQDLRKAAELYRRAALQGNAKGQVNLAQMLEDGSVLGASPERAYFWFSLAANRSDGALRRAALEGRRRVENLINQEDIPSINSEIANWAPLDPTT